LVWTSVPFAEPLRIEGKLPFSRINSISVYPPAGGSDAPNSIDLADAPISENRKFQISISHDDGTVGTTASSAALCKVSSNNWERGMVVMRNYLVPPGTAVVTPTIVRARDGCVVRPSEVLYAGAPNLALSTSAELAALLRVAALDGAVYVLYRLCFEATKIDKLHLSFMISASLLGATLLYGFLYWFAKRNLSKFCSNVCSEKNVMYLTTLEQGASVSQPSRLHVYWIMSFDIPDGDELSITGKINPAYQKYWSCVVYDEYGLPLPHHVYDDNVVRIKTSSSSTVEAGTYGYDIRLTTSNSASARESTRKDEVTVVDVSATRSAGYVLFRLVHPQHNNATTYSTPLATLLHPQTQPKKKASAGGKKNK
jgi:hypothetical protein